MSVRKVCILLAMSLLFAQAVPSQTRASLSVVPEKVANAEFPALDGSQAIRLSAYRPRVVVVALWASWCPACLMAMKRLDELSEGFSLNGVEVVGLTIEDPASGSENVRSFVRTYGTGFKIGWIGTEIARALTEEDAIPQIFVITGEGLIVSRIVGWHPDKSPKLLRKVVQQARRNPPVMQ
ncbi:MAG TPA: TlpA disulfide reductase family protein [Pyrinomonadaceae bacterium]|jgi:thiol-disulfide isomerase/thioredoxin|nr:TlpA disulfide reductase family protein [Pyrinomonadaceae bacterium]